MAKIFGGDYTRQEILTRVGDISQIAGVRRVRLADGLGEGIEAYEVKTGSGFAFTVLASRGMGIGNAEYCGMPLGWISPTGDVAPQFYEAEGLGFLRAFGGGLLVPCGLTNVGTAVEDGGEHYPIHGRIHAIPAEQVSYGGEWDGDDYVIWVQGRVREARVFAENLVLTRRISTRLGENTLTIEDKVENLGYEPTDHMILYHFNVGFPAVDDGAVFVADSKTVTPRDADAEVGIDNYDTFEAATPGFREQVFYHDVEPDADGFVTAGVLNPSLAGGFGFSVRYRKEELPVLVQWKMCAPGAYVTGVEPANCHVEGRVKERERGTLQTLQPGEARNYRLEVSVVTGTEEL
jgi:hypothetical protein